MGRPPLEVADIFRQSGPAYRATPGASLSPGQRRVMRAIESCRTAALGGHMEQCDHCGHQTNAYNSCRDRHCPKCQALAKAAWLEARQAELLPVEYFHVVFTVPESLGGVALQNKTVLYHLLFRAASQTLRQIAADPQHLGAEIGFLAVLHTWGQTLLHHPHLHCVVPGGGLSPDGRRWVPCRPGFFLPVRVLSRLFRRLFLHALQEAFDRGQLEFHGTLESLGEPQAFAHLLQTARAPEWVVYAKPPFGGPAQVLDYLGRYTHRVAIANHRLVALAEGQVTFRAKDYRQGNRLRTVTLDAQEFIRRFLLHVLPAGFMRIRHYGFLSNRHRDQKLTLCRTLLHVAAGKGPPQPRDWKTRYEALTGASVDTCPACRQGRLVRVEILPALAPLPRPLFPRMDSS